MQTRASDTLFQAISNLNLLKVEEILDQKKCHPDVCQNGTPALLHCIQELREREIPSSCDKGERLKLLKIFLRHGVALDAVDLKGRTAAMLAVETGQIELLKILKESGSDLFLTDNEEENLLMKAISRGYKDIVRYLLQHAPDLISKGDYTKTMLPFMARPELILCCYLFRMKTQTSLSYAQMKLCSSPLMAALMIEDNDDLVKDLVNHGADVNGLNFFDITPLMLAINHSNSHDCVKFLLEAGADPKAQDAGGLNALMYALKHAEDYDTDSEDTDGDSDSDSNQSDSNKSFQYVELLLKHGANVNDVDKEGSTPLMMAASLQSNRAEDYLKVLFKAGAKINMKDDRDQTALLYATLSENGTAGFLLKRAAKVNVVAKNGKTPLSCVISSLVDKTGSTDPDDNDTWLRIIGPRVLEILDYGADPSLSRQNQIYFNHLVKEKMDEILQMMIKNGCPPLLFPSLCLDGCKNTHMSALETALMYKHPGAARFLLSNRFLTQRDIVSPACRDVIKNKDWVDEGSFDEDEAEVKKRSKEIKRIINYLHSTPFSLFTLSFVAVSSCLDPSEVDFNPKNDSDDEDSDFSEFEYTFISTDNDSNPDDEDVVIYTQYSNYVYEVADKACSPSSSDQTTADKLHPSEQTAVHAGIDKVSNKAPVSTPNQSRNVSRDAFYRPVTRDSSTDMTFDGLDTRDSSTDMIAQPGPEDHLVNPYHLVNLIKRPAEPCPDSDQNKKSKFSNKQEMLRRKEKVKQLPLPPSLKRALLFRTSSVSKSPSSWRAISLKQALETRNFRKAPKTEPCERSNCSIT